MVQPFVCNADLIGEDHLLATVSSYRIIESLASEIQGWLSQILQRMSSSLTPKLRLC